MENSHGPQAAGRAGRAAEGRNATRTRRTRPIERPSTPFSPTCGGNAAAPSGADVLAVGDRIRAGPSPTGGPQFVYESMDHSGRYRDTRCTFSVAAAARGSCSSSWATCSAEDRDAQDPAEPARSTLHHRGRTHRLRTHVARRPGHLPHRRQRTPSYTLSFSWVAKADPGGNRRQLPPPQQGTALRSAPWLHRHPPASAFLTCRATAEGMTDRMTARLDRDHGAAVCLLRGSRTRAGERGRSCALRH